MGQRIAVRLFSCCLLVLLFAVSHTQAQSFFVPDGGVGNWSDPNNWSNTTLPDGDVTAYIHAGRNATVDSFISGVPRFVRVADFDQPDADIDGTLNIEEGGDLVATGQLLVGIGGDPATIVHGVLNQTGGSLAVGDALFLAFEPYNVAEYNLSGGTLTLNNLWLRFGNATVNQSGGDINAANLVVGEGGTTDTLSTYNLSGGTLTLLGSANIGRGLGGDPFPVGSNGMLKISGTGLATFEDLYFGTESTDVIQISGDGVLRVNQYAYPEATALADIAAGKILGNELEVSTIDLFGLPYTQIISTAEGLPGDFDGDGDVDGRDFLAWQRGESPTAFSSFDLSDWQNNYGPGVVAGINVVPEPAAIMLFTVAIACGCLNRPQKSC